MAERLPRPADSLATDPSHKRPPPHDDHFETTLPKRQAAHYTYDRMVTQDSSRAHFGDQYLHHEYHAPVYHLSDSTYYAGAQRQTPRTQLEDTLESLKFKQMDDHYLTLKSAYANTCQWLFERSEYMDWLDPSKRSANNGVLWIKGKPGAGKSTLVKCAVQYTQGHSEAATVIFFFFHARGSALERSTEGMYRSLLTQLVGKITRLQGVLGRQGQREKWAVELLRSLFCEAIMALGTDPSICYIDALDECDNDEVKDMIETFEELTELAAARGIEFRVCFSSRHYPHITMKTYQEMKLEDQKGHEDDIAVFVQSKLKVPLAKQSKSHIVMQIRLRASGIFLWVVLVIKLLNTDGDNGHVHKLKARLKQIPVDVNRLFEEIIHRGTEEDTYLVPTLQWIMFARRPLSCAELYHAIIRAPFAGAVDAEEDFRHEVTPEMMENFLTSSTKGLAELTKGRQPTTQFIHESVRDYLRNTGFKAIASDLCNDLNGASHHYLEQCCMHYVSEKALQ